MRILYITEILNDRLDPLPARVTHALARMAQREGHRVQVVTVPLGGDEAEAHASQALGPRLVDGVQVSPSRRMAPNGPPQLPSWLADQAFDLVHGIGDPACLALLEAQALARLPSVLTLSGLPAQLGALDRAALLVVPSACAAQRWQEAFPGRHYRVMPHGIDLLQLIQTRQAQKARRGPVQAPALLCAGPLDGTSGVRELLAAFALVRKPELRLHLQGEIDLSSGGGRDLLSAASDDPRVRLTNAARLSSLSSAAEWFDMVCLPSLQASAFSLMAHECVALGIPCLASDLGGQAEALRRCDKGQLLAPGDVRGWAAAIDRWASSFDPSDQGGMGAEVPLRIEEEAFLYAGLYRDLVFRHRP